MQNLYCSFGPVSIIYLRRHLITGALTIKAQCDILIEKNIFTQETSNMNNGHIEHLIFNDEFNFLIPSLSKFYVKFVFVANIAQYDLLNSKTMILHIFIL